MSKFIEIHDTVINIDDIRRVEFLGDDIYLGLFPKDNNGEVIGEFINFNFAKIYTFGNKAFLLSVDLYLPEEDESEEDWIKRNRSYIGITMTDLYEVLKPIKIGNKEYEVLC